MGFITILLILSSIGFSTGRNLLSKSISKVPFGERGFFRFQTLIFASGAAVFLLMCLGKLSEISGGTFLYAMLYGCLMLTAQWCYTIALNRGNVSVCTIIYSFGFIIPSLAGIIFWAEKLTFFKGLGILLVIPVIILAGTKKEENKAEKKTGNFLLPLLVAMTASGCLGIVQKAYQTSIANADNQLFLLLSFILCMTISFIGFMCCRNNAKTVDNRRIAPVGAGICYCGFTLTNATLVGMIDSSVLFPMLNISMILLSMALSVVFFGEKITRRKIFIVALGIVIIMLINLSS